LAAVAVWVLDIASVAVVEKSCPQYIGTGSARIPEACGLRARFMINLAFNCRFLR
jgi:hypothetical protein